MSGLQMEDDDKQDFRDYLLSKRPKPVAEKPDTTVVMQDARAPMATSRYHEDDDEEHVQEEAAGEISTGQGDEDGDNEDAFLDQLRERRMAELKRQAVEREEFRRLGHGEYSEITEQEFLNSVTKSNLCACHFYHRNFERCKILDKHLYEIAPQMLNIRFIRLNAEKAPFFVQKLSVRVLPSLIFFKDGVAVDRLLGFEGLPGKDEFETDTLVERIKKALLEAEK
eukprot:TRINITY_DN8876_c0_g1_i1.p1 TRINITY_DN8876_c0_g1~~TRINITY_DN8876_c0_g1_i1.p1  ORF type:complete len:225 (-),score=62.90 TRINITY_DN8876_c0_g1_i1:57-731(-)